MLGGVFVLGVAGFLSRCLSTFGLKQVAKGVVLKWVESGKTRDEIWQEVKSKPIPRAYKDYLHRLIFDEVGA